MLNLLQSGFPKLEELLAPTLMGDIRQLGRCVTYGDGELIQLRGESISGFSIIQSGQVMAGTEGADGSYLTAALLNQGDHFGDATLFAGLPRLQNLRAVGTTEILHIPAKKFLEIFELEPDVGRALLTIALRRIHFMMDFMDGQRRWPLSVRVAHLLLTSVQDREKVGGHTIHCRQVDLAEILGVSRVAVSKALKSLQVNQMVSMGYGTIEIKDVQQLLEWLENIYQVVPIQPDSHWRF